MEPINQRDEVQGGCILWLQKKEEISASHLNASTLDDGCFDHPVVIMSVDKREAIILIVSIVIWRVRILSTSLWCHS